jgi:hypothetical protein
MMLPVIIQVSIFNEVTFFHPVITEEFGHVVTNSIWQQHNTTLSLSQASCQPHSSWHSRPTAATCKIIKASQ